MGRFSIHPYVHLSVHPSVRSSVHPSVHPGPRASQAGLRPSQSGLRACQVGLRASKPVLRTDRRMDGQMDGWKISSFYRTSSPTFGSENLLHIRILRISLHPVTLRSILWTLIFQIQKRGAPKSTVTNSKQSHQGIKTICLLID